MIDILPSSILELAQTMSRFSDDIITVVMGQNGGSDSRYRVFEPMGDDVVERLIEEDFAYLRFPDQAAMMEALEKVAEQIEDGSCVSAEIVSFGDGNVVDTSRYNMD